MRLDKSHGKGYIVLVMGKACILAGLCALSSACATERPFIVKCALRGPLDQEPVEYADILEGSYRVDPARLERTPEIPGGGCSDVEMRSEVFGDPVGTRLQIIASRCGPGDVYVGSMVTLNGLPVYAHMNGEVSRVVFNDEDLKSGQPPITIPEGTFKFIYSDCEKGPAGKP